jgi:hypothetical protein
MGETRQNFKNADDWEKKYRPMMHGHGIRVRNNGTLFDRQGEDRKFVHRMEREFIWSVFHNGVLEYIQAGRHNDSNVVGYLITDNPVLFADLNSKFAIGYHAIDWNAFEHPSEPKLATEEVIDGGNVTVPVPEILAPAEQSAASVEKVEAEPACPEMAPGGEDKKSQVPAIGEKKDKAANPVMRLVGSFRRKTEDNRPIPASKAVEDPCAVPVSVPDAPTPQEPVPARVVAPLPPEMPPAVTTTPAPIPATAQAPRPARPAAAPKPKPRFARPKLSPLPFPQLAPLSTPGPDPLPTPPPKPVIVTAATVNIQVKPTLPQAKPPTATPAADPLPSPDTSAAAATAVQVRVRYLPIGTDAAKLDLQVYGPWPHATECKDCCGTGNFAGVIVGLIACECCEGRGWNPPADLVVSVK